MYIYTPANAVFFFFSFFDADARVCAGAGAHASGLRHVLVLVDEKCIFGNLRPRPLWPLTKILCCLPNETTTSTEHTPDCSLQSHATTFRQCQIINQLCALFGPPHATCGVCVSACVWNALQVCAPWRLLHHDEDHHRTEATPRVLGLPLPRPHTRRFTVRPLKSLNGTYRRHSYHR